MGGFAAATRCEQQPAPDVARFHGRPMSTAGAIGEPARGYRMNMRCLLGAGDEVDGVRRGPTVQRPVSNPKEIAIGGAVVEQCVDLDADAGVGLEAETVEIITGARDQLQLIAVAEGERVVFLEIE